MEITIAKTVADAIDRLVNKTDGGLKALIAAKLSKTDADNYYWKRTEKVSSALTADNATNANYATSAGSANSATNATNDGNGQNIANTYAKKTDIPSTSGYLTKSDADGYYLGKTAKAASASSADSATNATNDGNGNNIANTYAKKTEIPDTSNFLPVTKSGNEYYLSGKLFLGNATDNGGMYFTGSKSLVIQGSLQDMAAPSIVMRANGDFEIDLLSVKYMLKADGIYLNGTKITN